MVREAGLGDDGLTYPVDFLKFIEDNDTKWDQKTGLPVPFHAREY
jgi:hypothetical protein